ncbi:MAG: biotin/lipoyl-binding protein [Verrucomicrobiales bacterium]|nr:biotin/lipoyl-binding protein [Verrucomicrobiales bacterium]
MTEAPPTFSESWYRVAHQRVALRPTVQVHRQRFRGERWYVLQNPFNNQYFRLRPAAYEFVARLSMNRTVEEVWKECLERFPDEAPGQEAVLQLLAQLYHANLLQYPATSDASQLFKRYEKTRTRELRGRLLNIMFARIPLLDPDHFLVRTMSVVGKLISPVGAFLWLIVVGWALKVVADNFALAKDEAQGLLAPSNLPFLYLGLVILKTLHEFGHAYFCRKWGGEVHTMGVLFMIFTPVPYVDATSAWGLKERWKRVMVGLAGVIVELFIAALAVFVWAKTGPGTLHSVAYNMMFVASVSAAVFNLNPLLRFDGYYILSDLVEIPNLAQRANRQLRYWAEKFLYGLKKDVEPADNAKEAAWLGVFGVTSGVYRVFVFAGVLLFVADSFLLVGILMAAFCAVAWVITPTFKLLNYLASSPRLDRTRPRAIAVTAGLALLIVLFLQFVPFPYHFRAPGVARSQAWTEVHNETAGRVTRLHAQPGQAVVVGQPLLQLESPELDLELSNARARVEEVETRIRQALQEAVPNLEPLRQLRESALLTVHLLDNYRSNLVVRASQSGSWVFPHAEELPGRWLPRGADLGVVLDPTRFQFHAVIGSEDADRLFGGRMGGAEVRILGQAGVVLPLSDVQMIPAERRELPSAALGWLAGGPVRTAANDPNGVRAAEPFFEVRGNLAPGPSAALLHGRGGRVRFDLPAEPLLPRWIRALRQLLQRRYQL